MKNSFLQTFIQVAVIRWSLHNFEIQFDRIWKVGYAASA